jgi:ribonuclease R
MDKKDNHSKNDPHLERETLKYEIPVPSREFILATLNELKGQGIKRHALIKHFEIEDPDLQEALRRRLKAMVRDGQLLKTPKGYFVATHMETCEGIIVIDREGEGYLHTQTGKKISLSGPSLRGYFDGDRVEAHILTMESHNQGRGRVVRILEAVQPLVVGRFIANHGFYEVIPFDRKFTYNIVIPKEFRTEAKHGDIVQIEILRDDKYRYHRELVGKVIEILGDLSSPGIEVKIAIRKFGVPDTFSKAALKESESFGTTVSHTKLKDHKDIRHLPLVTIDGEDAKDFDDAVYCEKEAKGYRLWVAIADVSHYVTPGCALDREALNRGNSTYFPGSVVPMLPEALSNGLCSLKPKVDRLCLVCEMHVDEHGEISEFTFYRGIMESKARLTYTEVAEILKGNETLREQYAPVLKSLKDLHALYEIFHKARRKRGAIDFDTVETRILFDHVGKIRTIIPQVRNVAHKMIEESMLAANVCAAQFIQKHKRPALYRIHDTPPADKLTGLRHFLAELGLDLSGGAKPHAKDFAKLVERVSKREDRHMIETVMLRSLSQAQYSPKNIGHFGLAYPVYTHFTSPIRRYPDLLVHRTIVDIITTKRRTIMDVITSKNKRKPHLTLEECESIGLQCSESERRSDDATRDASLALKCQFMEDKVGQHFHGVISGVASFGIFVELKDIYVEGMIHVTGLGNEYFDYDPSHHRMIGERTRTMYRLGDPLEVRVTKVDVEAKRIELELLYPPEKSTRKKSKITSTPKAKKTGPSPKKRASSSSRRKRRSEE